MSMSIYEKTCMLLQPKLLKEKSKLSFEETLKFVEDAKEKFSKLYSSGYELASKLSFENNEKNSKNLEEVIQSLKTENLGDKVENLRASKLEAAVEAIAEIYGRTFGEVRDLYEGKKYWMSVSHLYN